jgi:hypothetical protein
MKRVKKYLTLCLHTGMHTRGCTFQTDVVALLNKEGTGVSIKEEGRGVAFPACGTVTVFDPRADLGVSRLAMGHRKNGARKMLRQNVYNDVMLCNHGIAGKSSCRSHDATFGVSVVHVKCNRSSL